MTTKTNVRNVGIISGGHFLSHFYIMAIPPLFPFLRDNFTLSGAELGLIISVGYVPYTLFQLPMGDLVDRYGSKSVFVFGTALTSLSIIATGFAPSYLWILAIMVVWGIGQSTFHPADFAMLDAVADEGTKGKAFSVHMFGGYAGYAAGPLFVGGVAILYDWRFALIVAGAVGLVYALFSFVFLDGAYRRANSTADADDGASIRESLSILARTEVVVLFVFFFILGAANKGIQTFTNILFTDFYGVGSGLGNASLTVFFVFVTVGLFCGGILSDRYAPEKIIIPSLLVGAIAVFGLVTSLPEVNPLLAVVLFTVIGAMFGMSLPSRDKMVTAISETGSTGKSFGLIYSASAVAGFVAPAVLGYVVDVASVGHTFVIVGVLFVAGVLLIAADRY